MDMNWKQSLDRYLTSGPPDDGFDDWADELIDKKLSDEFYNQHEEWILDHSGQCNKWINKLFNKNTDIENSAKIIERAYKLYLKDK